MERGVWHYRGRARPWQVVSECALTVEIGNQISAEILDEITGIQASLEERPPTGFLECVPGYGTLTLFFDPQMVSPEGLLAELVGRQHLRHTATTSDRAILEIPVCYGGEFGLDLSEVAERHGVSEGQVVAWHSDRQYRVHLLGFSPGFPYLGGLDPRLATPRLATPRIVVPAGSVAIADLQTGIYPTATSGGWRILGRTPIPLFSSARRPPSLLCAGDRVRFLPITPREFGLRWGSESWPSR